MALADIVADMAADMEVHMVADMGVDKVADMFADIVAKRVPNFVRWACKEEEEEEERVPNLAGVGHEGWFIGPQPKHF